jgi:hypothetical protein
MHSGAPSLLVAALLAAATPTFAAEAPPPRPPTQFVALDADGDSKLTAPELHAARGEQIARLEALGAKRVVQIQTWWVMEAPTGQKFCVIRPQREDFAARATTRGS